MGYFLPLPFPILLPPLMALSDEPRQLKLLAAQVALGEEFCAMLGAEWEKETVRNTPFLKALRHSPRPHPAGNQDAGQDCGKARPPPTQNKGPQERADRSNYE